MLSKVSERTLHWVRWGLTLGWFLLIFSLIYDPITPHFTDPNNRLSPFRLNPAVNLPEYCVKIRETCIVQEPFAMGALIWWAMIVPAGIFILLVFGHEFWRRICPLSFLSQIPRSLGLQRRRSVIDPISGKVHVELVTIGEQSWLGKNYLYVQFGLFIAGLGIRILFVNSDRIALFTFLIGSILCAILVGYLYAGKSWCNYFCPMAPVQLIYTGPRALLGSQAHLEQKPAITQSMCRTIDSNTGQERSACVGCKTPCIDIDAEKAYWAELNRPGRRLVQYGYVGMVIAFYLYYFLYAGNWDYYFTGLWTHEADQLAKIFDVGFYIAGVAIPIPKAVAVFLTFAVLVILTFSFGRILEKLYRRWRVWQGQSISAEQAQHAVFTLFTAGSFWTFFTYGARPWINRMAPAFVLTVNAVVIAVGAVWLFRTFGMTHAQYDRESMAISLRKQLQKLNIYSSRLDGQMLEALSADEVYTLVHILPEFGQNLRLQTYIGIVQDLLEQKLTDVSGSLDFCRKLRQELQIEEDEHFTAIEAIAKSHPALLVPSSARRFASRIHSAHTAARTAARAIEDSASQNSMADSSDAASMTE
jgi:hypothetical protein